MITEQQQSNLKRVELFEILDQVDKSKSEEEAVKVLQKFGAQYTSVKDYLRCVFDERIQFLLPDGKPPYAPADPNQIPSTWHKEHLKLKYFIRRGASDDVGQMKRERLFINTLESVHPEDALIMCKMVEKKTTTPKLTKEVADKAFPNLCG